MPFRLRKAFEYPFAKVVPLFATYIIFFTDRLVKRMAAEKEGDNKTSLIINDLADKKEYTKFYM